MKHLLCYSLLFISIYLYGQKTSVKGSVSDITKTPIEGVRVTATNSHYTVETMSDIDGNFQLIVPDTAAFVTISKPGYKNFSTEIISNTNINITLEYSELNSMSIEEILRTRVNTVTLKEEQITDVPGIVSVITGEELRNLGIRTVREALTLIPGFSPFQNDDEQILAVRGVFATTSQKILFMRDGHSLNEGNLDIPQMEFSISIENIQKIEIIRGPGASIYGNSAFAAVVNIITRDEDEIRVKESFGNNGYYDTDAYISKNTSNNAHVLAWGRFTSVDGEEKDVTINTGAINGEIDGTYKTYSYPLNYDVGFSYDSKHVKTALSSRRHQYNTYWDITGNITNVDNLIWQPGLTQTSIHYDLTFDFDIGKNKSITLQNYVDYSTLTNFRLTSNISDSTPNGIIQTNEWNVAKSGMNYYGTWNYSDNGSLIAGIAYEYRKYLKSWMTDNDSIITAMLLFQDYYPEANENRFAGYIQTNHSFADWIRLDIGARYDVAQEFKGTFNPRAAIIIYPTKDLSLKAIYTKAFQAPGYSYRNANSNASFSGSKGVGVLQPEIINTYQTAARYNFQKASYIEVAGYYNQLENMIARKPNSSYYSNLGKLASYGIEIDLTANMQKHSFFAHYAMLLPDTLYMDDNFKTLYIKDNRFKNLPQHTLNAGVTFRFLNIINWSVYTQYTSSYYASNNNELSSEIKIDSKNILNSTIRIINFHENIELGISVYNLTDKEYYLGDPTTNPLPQPGRWYNLSIVAKF